MTAPGRVTHTGRGDLIVGHHAGMAARKSTWRGSPRCSRGAEIPCQISDAIETQLWTKMTMNCACNALSALTRAQYGRMVQSPAVRKLIEGAVAETVAVARAEGGSDFGVCHGGKLCTVWRRR